MHPIGIIGVAVGLGLDAMSVCMSVGVRWGGARQKFRLAWHMGLFQFLMPIAGWVAGDRLAYLLRSVGSYVAAVLVFGIGAKMLYEAVRSRPGFIEERVEGAAGQLLSVKRRDPTRGWSLVLLSVATSIDALVVGFSLGLKGEQIFQASVVIGLVAALMALTGTIIGQRLGKAFGKPAEIFGAVILMLLGVSFLWL
ncbi:MAG: manganese efflux pump MntP [Planctomycetota bacterium]|jgi:putative Mn2+ efflux pump MntP